MISWIKKFFKRDRIVFDIETIRPSGTPICTYSKNGEEINTFIIDVAAKVKF